jgi:hypothetical protein
MKKTITNQQKGVLNAISFIDGIVGSLSRGGPGREVIISFRSRCLPSWQQFVAECGEYIGLRKITPTKWKISGTSTYEALHLTRGVLEVINDAIPKFGLLPLKDQLGLFVRAKEWPLERFIKYAKYVTVWPLARYMRQVMPPRPEGFEGSPLVFVGKVKRILKNRLVSFSDKNSRLWAGYLQGVKRACAPPTKDFIRKSMLDHKAVLSTPPPPDPDLVKEIMPYIRRACRKFKAPKEELFEASTSASYEFSRKYGGAREFIRDSLTEAYEDVQDMPDDVYADYQLARDMRTSGLNPYKCPVDDGYNQLLSMVETKPGLVEEMRGVALPTFDQVVVDIWGNDPDHPPHTGCLNTCFRKTKSGKPCFGNEVMVSPVKEPLKIRLISKGNAKRYWLSKFFQKGMWEHLQKYPQFAPTGRPMDASDLYGIILKEEALGIQLPEWVSGDYSAATDGVNLNVTMAIFNELLSKAKYDLRVKEILRSVIGPQFIEYPWIYNKDGDLDGFLQQNGQLMGSPLSFPILCLINLVAYWISFEEYLGFEVGLEQLPVLINGDDILFRANDRLYTIWQYWITKVGFKLSLGKNYKHAKLLTINSQLYRFDPVHRTFWHLTYMNPGLLTGQAKITGRKNAQLAPIWDYFNEVVPNALQPERARRRFMHYHREQIDKYTRSGEFNLFLPFRRGGLGFDHVGPFRTTSFQRRFATFLENRFMEAVESGIEPKGETLGLVREARPVRAMALYHQPQLVTVPSIGPMLPNVAYYQAREKSYPPLAAEAEEDADFTTYRIKLPRRALKAYRSAPAARMGDRDIRSWGWTVGEMIRLTA